MYAAFYDFNSRSDNNVFVCLFTLILDDEHLFLDFDTKLSKHAPAGWKEQVCLCSFQYENCMVSYPILY